MIELLADDFPTVRQTGLAIVFPAAGLLLLTLGIRRRLAWRRWNDSDNARLLDATASTAPDTHSGGDDDHRNLLTQPAGKGTVLIIVGAVALILGAGHVLSYVSVARLSHAIKVEVGQCITTSDFEQRRITAEPVDCDRADATLQLASEVAADANCPDGNRDGALYQVLSNHMRTLCFVLNLHEGRCYAGNGIQVTPTECSDPRTNVMVNRRIEGSSDTAGCPTGTVMAVSYPEPPRVYCARRG